MYNLVGHLATRFNPDVRFHNVQHTLDMLQVTGLFVERFVGLFSCFGRIDLLCLFFTNVVLYMGHSGLTDEFLVRVRHPRAIRYNDKSLSLMYNLSTFFNDSLDPEHNFFIHADDNLRHLFRKMIIRATMRLDFKLFFSEMSFLQTKVVDPDFPRDDDEDRLIVLCSLVRLADLSWSMRNANLFFRWVDKFNDEFFWQGDLEREMGLDISPCCDRDFVDTSKVNVAYMMVIVGPFARVYTMFLPESKFWKTDLMEEGLDANRNCLQSWIRN